MARVAIGLLALTGFSSGQSSGCGRTPPQDKGKTSVVYITDQGVERLYRIHVPPGYNSAEPTPLVFSYHGWGSSAASDESYMGFTAVSDSHNFIIVYPEGMSDYNRETNNGWQSFNAMGSTTTLGNECTSRTTGYCYQSCAKRPQGCGRCDWTSCYDDAEFTETILDSIESDYCIDSKRIFATGYSNGGIMAYEAGYKLGHRFAAIAPGGGTPFVGHNNAPAVSRNGAVSVMDLHGTRDTTCPANTTTSADGWNYEPVDSVMKVWASAHGCSGSSTITKYDTAYDGDTKLWCVKFGNCANGVDFVRCSYDLAHHWLGYNKNGGTGAQLAWAFLSAHPKVSAAELNATKPSVSEQ
eukprot:m.27910 g.27910  ORF g.27910 m.27910 type:complete len:354 (+) comp6488_c0_seq1:84-1145(+)